MTVVKILKNETSRALKESDAMRQSAHTNCNCFSLGDSFCNSIHIFNMFDENRYEPFIRVVR